LRGVSLARKYFKEIEWPSALVEMRARQWQNNLTWIAYAIMVHNLEKNMLANQTVSLAEYEIINSASVGKELACN
jgi:hypothetical protein